MYPLFLDLKNRLVVVVGAGPVGRRKIAGLLACGARVRVVCLESASTQGVEWWSEPYRESHLTGATLVFAAATTDVSAQVVRDARRLGVLVCNASDGTDSDFQTPAVFRSGPITVAVSTSGQAPSVAAALRDHLAQTIGPEWIEKVIRAGNVSDDSELKT